MSEINWLEVVPSVMSMVAAVAATIAAFVSLKISGRANQVAEMSILAELHGSAANALTDAVKTIQQDLKPFSELARDVWIGWAEEIGRQDDRKAGGSNPRPLRHVLANGSEMLVKHGSRNGTKYRSAHHSMFSIIREGISDISDEEYKLLLKKADGVYGNFESVFGEPNLRERITSSPAFRWVYYQLIRRVPAENWTTIWRESFAEGGRVKKYRDEHETIRPILKDILDSMRLEKDRLAHSVFPLGTNPSLSSKYDNVMEGVEVLLEDCALDLWVGYVEQPHQDDVVPLIVYTMGIIVLVESVMEKIAIELG